MKFAAVFALMARMGLSKQSAAATGLGEPEVIEGASTTELRLSGFIVSHDSAEWFPPGAVISDVGFQRALTKAQALGKQVSVRVSSDGGEVRAGLAIAQLVREGGLPVRVDGWAASIAANVVAASPQVTMSPGALIMVHNPHSGVMGNAHAMRAEAKVLDDIRDGMAAAFAARKGALPAAAWLALMDGQDPGDDGTWLSAEAAVTAGLADVAESGDYDRDKRAARLALFAGATQPPKILDAVVPPVQRDPGNQNPSKGASVLPGAQREFKPGARVSHRPGAFYKAQ